MAAWSARHGPVPAEINKKEAPKWLSDKQAPWKKLHQRSPKGETIAYDKLPERTEVKAGRAWCRQCASAGNCFRPGIIRG